MAGSHALILYHVPPSLSFSSEVFALQSLWCITAAMADSIFTPLGRWLQQELCVFFCLFAVLLFASTDQETTWQRSCGGGSPREKRKQSMSLSRCKSHCKKSHFYWNSMPHLSIVSSQMGRTARNIPTDTGFITCMVSRYLVHLVKLGAGGL